ncbi:hypothetical protein XH91_27495 [Bradyrhizobium guangzhouense]|uniref:Uncharacterized protein n=1 Tax=Bradyrhizobium guangzhouense TaxID=1325095 RepID=A0AAE6CAI2_9BRAD|nr:hypothetical protein XH91_27495 [Bradyrhizobium guangzhouense]
MNEIEIKLCAFLRELFPIPAGVAARFVEVAPVRHCARKSSTAFSRMQRTIAQTLARGFFSWPKLRQLVHFALHCCVSDTVRTGKRW